MPTLVNHGSPFASMRIIQFRHLMTGRFIFIIALRMMATVVGWWVYELTGDPFAIGLIGLSEVIPAISLALYAGHVIDKSEKRALLLKGVLFYFLCALALVFLSTGFTKHYLSNHQITIGIYSVIFCSGIIRAFAGPVTNVLLAHIVPNDHLANATTWSQGTWLSASVTGHALGGFLIALMGINGTFITITALISIAFLIFTFLKKQSAIPKTFMVSTWESVKEGLRFVYKTKEILGALTLDLFAVLFGGAVAMVPVFAKDILNVGVVGFGWLNAAVDMGAICIVVLLTIFPMKTKQGKKLFFAIAGFGICIIIFAFSKSFLLSFIALLIAGMLDGVSVVVRGTILQLNTPMELRGRVMSVNSMFISSSNELGQFESGLAAKIMGVIPSVVFGGGMTLLVVIVTWIKAPKLRKLQY